MRFWDDGAFGFSLFALSAAIVLNVWAILRVRVWNPSRELRLLAPEHEEAKSIWGVEHDLAQSPTGPGPSADAAEAARAGHVDARVRTSSAATRRSGTTHPVAGSLYAAYGRKVP
jgi:hypothetical protein